MASVRFNLRDKKLEVSPINVVIRWSGNRLVYPSGEKIKPSNWNHDKQRVSKSDESFELNSRLDNLKSAIANEYRSLIHANDHRVPSPGQLKKALDDRFSPNLVEEMQLMGFIDKYIDEARSRVNPTTGKPLSKGTINNYRRIRDLLIKFRKRKGPLTFEDIDLDFYHSFNQFMMDEMLFSTNTSGKHVKTLKGILNEATERGVNKNLSFKSKRFKAISETVETIYLNMDELAAIGKLDLSHSKRLDNARDLFLIGSYTGLRYSDYSDLRKAKITKTEIKLLTQKTQSLVVIPILPELRTILDKHSNEGVLGLPKKLSNPKLNKYIKEVCAMVPELQINVEITHTKAGTRVTRTIPKYAEVKSHTARRSFATNAFEMGIPTISIRAITQHKTDKEFMKYIRATSKTHSDLIRKNWHQNTNLKAI